MIPVIQTDPKKYTIPKKKNVFGIDIKPHSKDPNAT